MSVGSFNTPRGIRLVRLAAALGAFAAFMLFATTSALAFSESYAFAGLEWGSKPEVAARQLQAQGFKVTDLVAGARREFVEQNAWGAFENMDRGKRLVARGLVAGRRVTVDLVFGYNDGLERIIIGAPDWDGTRTGAARMTKFADTLTSQLEDQYGRSYDKRMPFGFVDTARWMPAQDGSRMELYVRGTNGYMFFPKDTTSLRVHIWNDHFRVARPDTMTAGDGKAPGTQAARDSTRDAANTVRARRDGEAGGDMRAVSAPPE